MKRRQENGISTTEAAILGLLRLGERSGYDLSKMVRGSIGFFWSPAQSQIYAVLGRLVDGGHARRRAVRQEQRPDKQLYRITPAGVAALDAWLAEPELEPAAARNPFVLKLFLGEFMEAQAVVEHIERGRADAQAELAQLEAIGPKVDTESHPYDLVTLDYGIAHCRATIRWADRALSELEAARRSSPGARTRRRGRAKF